MGKRFMKGMFSRERMPETAGERLRKLVGLAGLPRWY